MRPTSIACVCLAVLSTVCLLASAEERVFVTEVQLYSIQGDISGKTSLSEGIQAGLPKRKQSAKRGPFTFFTRADLDVANFKLQADEDRWTWDGRAQPPKGSRVEIIAHPRVKSTAGERFTVMIGGQRPTQYFEKRPDGLFELKESLLFTGIGIEATVDEGKSGRIMVRNLQISANLVLKRRPIEGVSLNVGPPVIEEYETTISVKPGRYYGLLLSDEGQGGLLIRLRVDVESPLAHSERAVPER